MRAHFQPMSYHDQGCSRWTTPPPSSTPSLDRIRQKVVNTPVTMATNSSLNQASQNVFPLSVSSIQLSDKKHPRALSVMETISMQICRDMSISHSPMLDMSELSRAVLVQQSVNGIAHQRHHTIAPSPIAVSLVQLIVVQQAKPSVLIPANVQLTVRPVVHLPLLNSRLMSTNRTSNATPSISKKLISVTKSHKAPTSSTHQMLSQQAQK